MKFNLAETVFKLNEPLCLQEKFTLLEADEVIANYEQIRRTATAILNKEGGIKSAIQNLQTNSDKTENLPDRDLLKQIQNAAENAVSGLRSTENLAQIKSYVSQAVATMNKLVTKYASKTSDAGVAHVTKVIELINSIKEAAAFKKPKQDIKTLDTLLTNIDNMIISLLSSNGDDNGVDGNNTALDGSTNKEISQQKSILNYAYRICSMLANDTRDKIEKSVGDRIYSALVRLEKADSKEIITASTDFIQAIANPNDSKNNLINKIYTKEEKAEADAKASDEANIVEKGKINWESQYKKLGDTNQFWDNYYKVYWKEDANTIKGYGSVFKQECKIYGFTEKTNPFIIYLKQLNKLPTSIAYTVIHNSAAQKILKRSDLLSKSIRTCNVIYNKEFISGTNADDLEDYITIQHTLLNKTSLPDVSSNDPIYDDIQQIKSELGNSSQLGQIANSVIYKTLSGTNFEAAQLRDIRNVNALCDAIAGENGKTKPAMTPDVRDNVVNAMLSSKSISLDTWIIWMFTVFGGSKDMAKHGTEVASMNTTLTGSEAIACQKAFNKASKGTEVSDAYASDIFNKLLQARKNGGHVEQAKT